MSGHSKWANIKYQKGAVDAKRSALFTKLAKNITVAAREGGGDVSFNFKLRTAIDAAKAGNVPKDNIERAVKRGTGELEGARIEEVVYEGYGPGGAAIIINALTDSRNRTSSSLKHIFSKNGGNLGATGAVLWMFLEKGIIRVAEAALPSDEGQMALIDAGAEDIAVDDDGTLMILSPKEALQAVVQAAASIGLVPTSVTIEWLPKEHADAPADTEALLLLLEALDDDEDVDAVFTNVDV
jgi:YebC/PmpR family DNA-binding regulatory protein